MQSVWINNKWNKDVQSYGISAKSTIYSVILVAHGIE